MKRQAVIFLLAIFLGVFATQAGAMTIPEARVWGTASDGWNIFDHTELYSHTSSLSYEYNGPNAGYANYASGDGDHALGGPPAYAVTDGTTTNCGGNTGDIWISGSGSWVSK